MSITKTTLHDAIDFNDLSDESKEALFQDWVNEKRNPKPKVQLTGCNECLSILVDRNPSDELDQPLQDKPIYAKEMIFINGQCEGELFWACPVCRTDEYLYDIDVILAK